MQKNFLKGSKRLNGSTLAQNTNITLGLFALMNANVFQTATENLIFENVENAGMIVSAIE